MIRNLFLDADDTLFDFHRSERQAIANTLRQLGLEPTDSALRLYSEINAAHWRMLERREITRAQLRLKRYECFLQAIGSKASPERAASMYEEELSKGHFFMEGAERLVRSLTGRYRLYITSNGFEKTQRGRLANSGLADCFEDVFISQLIGADKPDLGFFEGCFDRIPYFEKSETLILGDGLTSDILGGKHAGITTVWYNPKGLPAQPDILPDYEIRHLDAFLPLLERL